jgi:uncharacterized protein
MCTGYTRDTHQYFMKASPVRPGDFIEFFAEIDLLVALSACPGGDCGASHSDDSAKCYPLKVEVHRPRESALAGWQSPPRTSILARMEFGEVATPTNERIVRTRSARGTFETPD